VQTLKTALNASRILPIGDLFCNLARNERFANVFAQQIGLPWTQKPRQVLQRFVDIVAVWDARPCRVAPLVLVEYFDR
jgi:hypothetical protein